MILKEYRKLDDTEMKNQLNCLTKEVFNKTKSLLGIIE